MLYFAYLDEFGHIGPYVARDDPAYNDSPVFGLGGMILPASSVRQFSTWFYQLKCNMLAWEIGQSGQHPATWEKKGSALFTTMNVEKYRQVRTAANRILNKIRACGVSCPLLSGPSTMTVWIKEGTTNAFEEAQARGDYREAA